MNYLQSLKPAEIHLLLENGEPKLKDMLRLTFLELLRKKVLVFEEHEKPSRKPGMVRVYKYVTTGPAYQDYNTLSYEAVFLNPYKKDPARRILFRSLIRITSENAHYDTVFRKKIIESSLNRHFYQNRLRLSFGLGRVLSASGETAKIQIQKEIRDAEQKLNNHPGSYTPDLVEYILALGTGVLFLQNWESIKDYWKTDIQQYTDSSTEWYSSSDFYDYNTSSDSESWDTGCSSDSSGCSGCSGCGGGGD